MLDCCETIRLPSLDTTENRLYDVCDLNSIYAMANSNWLLYGVLIHDV